MTHNALIEVNKLSSSGVQLPVLDEIGNANKMVPINPNRINPKLFFENKSTS